MPDAHPDGKEWAKNSEALTLARRALPSYCVQQRWYPAKDAEPCEFSLSELIPLQQSSHAAALAFWNVTVEGREPFQIFVPLAVIPQGAQRGAHTPIIGTLSDGRVVIDALESDSFIKEFVSLMLPESCAPSSHLQTGHADQIAALRDIPVSQWLIKRSGVEQSNTSMRVSDISILKVIRKIAPGIHPELEMARFLTEEARFRATPALLGWINLDENTIAILQEFIPNQGDGWTWVQAQLQAGTVDSDKALEWLAILGQRTAELHEALNIGSDDEAFRTEIAGREDWQRWSRDLAAMSARVRQALVTRSPELDSNTRRLAAEFHESVQGLDEWLLWLMRSSPAWRKTRHHGDYHLGQVLVCGDAAVIVDFEGEPMRSLHERRAKHVPLRDVAGMLRSIQYASAVAQRELPVGMSAEHRSSEVNRLNKWSADACRVFTENYLKRLGDGSSEPIDRAAATRIVQFFLIEKGLYEILYELSNRPDWASIPLQGVISQFGAS